MKRRNTFIWFISLLFICSCSEQKEEGEVLAQVYQEELRKSEVIAMAPKGGSDEMMKLFTRNYTQGWVESQILVHESNQVSPDILKKVEAQLAQQKRDLVLYYYEQDLVNQKLDTMISDSLMRNYYEKNKKDFELKLPVARVFFLKVPENWPAIYQMEYKFYPMNEKSILQLIDFCGEKEIFHFYSGDNNWVDVSDLRKEIPVDEKSLANTLLTRKNMKYQREGTAYYLKVLEVKNKGDIAPFEYERDNIKKLILNERKLKLISENRRRVIKKAWDANRVIIYEKDDK